MRALLLLLALAGSAWGHGGTSHSTEMAVDNELVISPNGLTIEQVHRCRLAVAEGIWRAGDTDRDGKLSDAELAKAAADSKTLYQQWCRVDVDWKLALPKDVTIEWTSFPRERPTTFGGVELAITHRALYELPPAGGARSIAFNCTSLNARTVRTKVRAEAGVRIESTSLGHLDAAGRNVTGAEQVDGTPDQIALLVRSGADSPAAVSSARPSAPPGNSPSPAQTRGELAFGFLALAAGFYMIVARSVRIGRHGARAAELAGLAAGFAVVGLGTWSILRALVSAGVIVVIP